MASIQQAHGQDLMVGVFQTVQETAHAVDQLVEAGFDRELLGLLMLDRTAQRHFGRPHLRNPLGVSGHGDNVSRLSARLKAMAPLGTPGSGIVAAGPIQSIMTAAGLGSRGTLEHALTVLGTERHQAHEVAERVKRGAAMVSAPLGASEAEPTPERALRQPKAETLQLHLERPQNQPFTVVPAEIPAGRQNANFEPAIDPGPATLESRGVDKSPKA